jgi:drug/metabolite transporter (DMT)-like permease
MAATVFGILLFREPLDVFSGLGITLVLLAVFLLSKTESGKE